MSETNIPKLRVPAVHRSLCPVMSLIVLLVVCWLLQLVGPEKKGKLWNIVNSSRGFRRSASLACRREWNFLFKFYQNSMFQFRQKAGDGKMISSTASWFLYLFFAKIDTCSVMCVKSSACSLCWAAGDACIRKHSKYKSIEQYQQ